MDTKNELTINNTKNENLNNENSSKVIDGDYSLDTFTLKDDVEVKGTGSHRYSVWSSHEIPESRKIWGVKNTLKWIVMWMVPGFGMFNESYLIFSTGQVKSLWKKAYPTCWSPNHDAHCPNLIRCNGLFNNATALTSDVGYCNADGTYPATALCDQTLLKSISYSEFAGIMLGMLILAFFSDKLGRRFGSISTAMIMALGAILMTLSMPFSGLNPMFIWFTVAYFVYGFGVGGEYPISGSSAAERTQTKNPASERGREISLTFSMQGVGAVVGSLVIMILLVITGQNSASCVAGNTEAGYDVVKLDIVWRVVYGIGAFFCLSVFIYRFYFLKESQVFQNVKAMTKANSTHDDDRYKYDLSNKATSYYIAFRFYGSRMLGTAGCWFLWDIAFYGNKLFSAPIFKALVPGGDLITLNGYILLNNSVALVGYYVAAGIIDYHFIGRRRLQFFGFTMITILFGLTAGLYYTIDSNVLLFLYIFSSFWGQCGPNVTTFVSPAELYPTKLRSICHGISAFSGKSGALIATIAFGYLNTQQIFIICTVVSFIGAFFTFFFLPDVTGMELVENDRYLEAILLNPGKKNCLGQIVNPEDCEARNPKYLSRFERLLSNYGY